MANRSNGGVQSVERVFDILEALAAADHELGASELARMLGLPYATIHRLTATLIARGYVHQHPESRRYVLGPRLAKLGASASRDARAWVQPYLEWLVEAVGETANLAVLEDGYVVYVAQTSSERMVRMFTEVGNRVHPHSTAVGKVLLAHQPREVVEGILRRLGMPAATPNTITDVERFMDELDSVRAQGYAVDLEEQEEGVCCVAVPVAPIDGWVAAISVSGPSGRLGEERRERILAEMRRLTDEMQSAGLGGEPRVTV